jgi:hypothetical protein
MSRTKGSLNKATLAKMQAENKKGGGVSIMHFDKQIENSAIVRPNAQYGIMNWGRDNLYFTCTNLTDIVRKLGDLPRDTAEVDKHRDEKEG